MNVTSASGYLTRTGVALAVLAAVVLTGAPSTGPAAVQPVQTAGHGSPAGLGELRTDPEDPKDGSDKHEGNEECEVGPDELGQAEQDAKNARTRADNAVAAVDAAKKELELRQTDLPLTEQTVASARAARDAQAVKVREAERAHDERFHAAKAAREAANNAPGDEAKQDEAAARDREAKAAHDTFLRESHRLSELQGVVDAHSGEVEVARQQLANAEAALAEAEANHKQLDAGAVALEKRYRELKEQAGHCDKSG